MIVAPFLAASIAFCRSSKVRAGESTVTEHGAVAVSPQNPAGTVVVVVLDVVAVEVVVDSVVEVEVDAVVEVDVVSVVEVAVVSVVVVVDSMVVVVATHGFGSQAPGPRSTPPAVAQASGASS